jgi:glycerol-3-phosphate dehydrogenase
LQGPDGRIIFAIPYEQDFTLIGTTDMDHPGPDTPPELTEAERDYLLGFINRYLAQPLGPEDIVHSFSGVRPLYDDGANAAQAATRDYVLTLDAAGPPILSVFGGKITTYRKLAEHALAKLAPFFPAMDAAWTARVPLPGGDFPLAEVETRTSALRADYPFLTPKQAQRLFRAYGTEAWDILGRAKVRSDLGQDFGAGLSEAELRWMITHEFARTADDVLWRRSKLGLVMTPLQTAEVDRFLRETLAPA